MEGRVLAEIAGEAAEWQGQALLKTEAATVETAEWLAKRLPVNAVLALHGELAAGKTRFTQALVRAFGFSGVVNSPTFVLAKEYETPKGRIHHMDMYRIDEDQAAEIGLDEKFGDGLVIVEWASRIRGLLPAERLEISLSRTEHTDARRLTIAAYGASYLVIAEQAEREGRWQSF